MTRIHHSHHKRFSWNNLKESYSLEMLSFESRSSRDLSKMTLSLKTFSLCYHQQSIITSKISLEINEADTKTKPKNHLKIMKVESSNDSKNESRSLRDLSKTTLSLKTFSLCYHQQSIITSKISLEINKADTKTKPKNHLRIMNHQMKNNVICWEPEGHYCKMLRNRRALTL